MSKRNMIQWLNELKNFPVKKTMPILSFPSVQLMGITVKDLISDSKNQAEGMRKIAERVDSLASVSLMDLSVEAECFGSRILVSEDEVPTVIGHVVSSEEDAKALKVPEVGAGRTGIYLDAIQQVVQLIQDRPVFAGVIGPFSLTGRLVDVTEAMIYCYDEPDMMHEVLGKATEFLISYVRAYKERGADGVVIAEPLSGLLSPDLEKEFSAPYVKRIIDAVQDENFIVIYHNCGDKVVYMTESLFGLGAGAYHFGNAIDMEDMLKKAPSDTVIMGNIDPAGEFRNGTPDSIRKATLNLLERCSKYSNFVISSGCDIPPLSKWENIEAYFQAVSDFYKDKN